MFVGYKMSYPSLSRSQCCNRNVLLMGVNSIHPFPVVTNKLSAQVSYLWLKIWPLYIFTDWCLMLLLTRMFENCSIIITNQQPENISHKSISLGFIQTINWNTINSVSVEYNMRMLFPICLDSFNHSKCCQYAAWSILQFENVISFINTREYVTFGLKLGHNSLKQYSTNSPFMTSGNSVTNTCLANTISTCNPLPKINFVFAQISNHR